MRPPCVLGESRRDCGPAALATVALHYGVRLSLLRVHHILRTDAHGTTLQDLATGASAVGFSAVPGRLPIEHLADVELPCIAHTGSEATGHFVVVYAVSKDRVLLADPARGIRRIRLQEFLAEWTGHVLLLRPTSRLRSHVAPRRWLWELLSAARSQRRLLMPSVWLAVAVAVLTYATSFFVRGLLDTAIPRSDAGFVRVFGAGMIVVVLVRTAFGMGRTMLLAHGGRHLALDLMDGYVRHLLSLPMLFFERHAAGDVFTRFLDAQKAAAVISGPILFVMLDVVLLLACAVFMAWYSVSLTVLACGVLPAYVVVAVLTNAAVRRLERVIRERFSTLANAFIESITNIRVIKAYGIEPRIYERLDAANEAMQESVLRRAMVGAALAGASGLTSGIATVSLLWVGTDAVIDRRLSVGQLMFFYSVLALFLASVERIGSSIVALQEGAAGVDRVLDVKAFPPEDVGTHQGLGAEICRSIEFRDVAFSYRTRDPVVQSISLRMSAGETLAIVGETGSGKSTLLSLINGLYVSDQGTVLVNDRDIRTMDRLSLRKQISVVIQETGLMTGTIAQNIAFGVDAPSVEQLRHAAHVACANFIDALPGGFAHEIGFCGTGLSAGQRQRIAIARAMYRNPSVLILDEATSNLDPETERRIMERLAVTKASRMTVLATHRIALAAHADRVIVLDQGRMVESGTHRELLARGGRYTRMWRTFAGVGQVFDEVVSRA